ncbi:MAG: peptidylprolyl isomerase [candidate division Zixibacteria bacterium]|nr:peptidylprolyl isomerase [candidate division Zixibacteria bacterium]
MRKSYLIGLFALAAILLTLTGCGTNDDVLAVIGDYELTADEFESFFRPGYAFSSAEDEFEKRKEVLDTLIVTRLLVQGAYEKGIDRLEELARVVLANKDKLLVDVLAFRKVSEKSEPSLAEMNAFWEKQEFKVRASHILVSDVDTAQMLIERIEAGENFEKLAHEYSIDPSASKNKGDLGYFTWGNMVDAFQEAAWAMEPGQVSPPVKTRYGYHIIKVVDRLPNEYRTDFESAKNEIKDQLTSIKRRQLGEAYFEDIRGRYVIRIDTATCDYLMHKREMVYPPQLLKTLPRNDFDPEQLDRSESELVLATWNGGQMSISEYLDLARNVPSNLKPDLDDYDSLATVVFNMKLSDILILEAHSDGIDNDPMYLDNVRLLKELSMADLMKNDSISTLPPPDDEAIRQYYDEHVEEFTDPARVRVYEILLSDELKAQKLAKEIKSRQAFKNQAMDLTERPGKRAEGGDLGFIERQWFPEIYDVAVEAALGSIVGPIPNGGKYSVIFVEDRIDAVLKDYLGQKRIITQMITSQQKADAITAWVNERKQATSIEINEDAIRATINMEKYAAVPEQSDNQ